jgi:predicted phosphodiesterase
MNLLVLADLHYGYSIRTHHILDKFFKSLPTDYDYCIVAGDIISHSTPQIVPAMELMSKYLKNVRFVLGNHDYWEINQESRWPTVVKFRDMLVRRIRFANNKKAKDKKILQLKDYPIVTDTHIVLGYNSWYESASPISRDKEYMPKIYDKDDQEDVMKRMTIKAETALGATIQYAKMHKGKKKVLVTHMPPYIEDTYFASMCGQVSHYEKIKSNFDMLICGHNHSYRNDGFVVNPGSDYDNPKYIIVEI